MFANVFNAIGLVAKILYFLFLGWPLTSLQRGARILHKLSCVLRQFTKGTYFVLALALVNDLTILMTAYHHHVFNFALFSPFFIYFTADFCKCIHCLFNYYCKAPICGFATTNQSIRVYIISKARICIFKILLYSLINLYKYTLLSLYLLKK